MGASEPAPQPSPPWWRTPPLQRWARLQQRENQVFLALALLIGAITGAVVVAFIVLTEHVGMRLYPAGSNPWRRLLIPITGSLVIGYLLFRYFPFARGSGVPQTKAALYAREGRIRLRTVFGKFFCTSATLASGIPLGREGPSVQVGGGIASVLGRAVGMSPERVKLLLPVGASAAIAAAFNTPLAAVLFSLEEVVGDLHAPVLGAVVLSSATAWIVLRLLLGNNPLFKVPQYQLVHPAEFAVYAVLGVFGGLVSAAFSQMLLRMRAFFLRLPQRRAWVYPVFGGIVVGIMGVFVPQVLGVGYGYVGEALNGNMALKLMLILVVLKLIGVTTSYASGNAGGIFGPALFIGAMLGGSVGAIAHRLFPMHTATAGAYALVGMGAAFAGIVRAPMTSVLMIFEMTQDYAVIVPLMIANLISLFIASRLQRMPIYDALALQDGIHLPSSHAHRPPVQRVARIMIAAPKLLSASMTIAEAAQRARNDPSTGVPAGPPDGRTQTIFVSDERGFIGALDESAILSAEAGGKEKRLAELVDPLTLPHLHSDHTLAEALERFGKTGLDALPVVSRANVHQVVGMVTLKDVLKAYGVDQK
jgi:CIC family chloride channel protein